MKNRQGDPIKINDELRPPWRNYKPPFRSLDNIWFRVPRLWWSTRELVEFVEKGQTELAAIVPDLTTDWMTRGEVLDYLPRMTRHKLRELIENERLSPYYLANGGTEIMPAPGGPLFKRSEVEAFAKEHAYYKKTPPTEENPDKTAVRIYSNEKIHKKRTITKAELVDAIQETPRITWKRKKLFSPASGDSPAKHYSDRTIEEWLHEFYEWPRGRSTDLSGPKPRKPKSSV